MDAYDIDVELKIESYKNRKNTPTRCDHDAHTSRVFRVTLMPIYTRAVRFCEMKEKRVFRVFRRYSHTIEQYA